MMRKQLFAGLAVGLVLLCALMWFDNASIKHYLQSHATKKDQKASIRPEGKGGPNLPRNANDDSIPRFHMAPSQKPANSQALTISSREWLDMTRQIRAMESGPEKTDLIDRYMKTSGESHLSTAILDALSTETDRILLDHEILLLQRIIDGEGIKHLVEMIDKAQGNTALQELLLKVMENVSSPSAMPALREIVRSNEFSFKEPLLFYALRSIARSGEEDDVQALFDRINAEAPADRQKFSYMVTAAVDFSNPNALSTLLNLANGSNSGTSKDAQLIAIYSLRNYREDREANRLLNDLEHNPNQAIAKAASEALIAPK